MFENTVRRTNSGQNYKGWERIDCTSDAGFKSYYYQKGDIIIVFISELEAWGVIRKTEQVYSGLSFALNHGDWLINFDLETQKILDDYENWKQNGYQ